MSDFYIIVYDDGMGVFAPMGLDPDCDGAVSIAQRPVALFTNRRAANRAIAISKAHAALLRLKGQVPNDDFLPPFAKNIKVVKASVYSGGEQ